MMVSESPLGWGRTGESCAGESLLREGRETAAYIEKGKS